MLTGCAGVRKWNFPAGLKMMIVPMKMKLGARGWETIKSVVQILNAGKKRGNQRELGLRIA